MRFPDHPTADVHRLCGLAAILLFLCSCHSSGLPSRLERIPADLSHPGLELSGVYEDGWMEAIASLRLEQPEGMHSITVRGMVPKIGDRAFSSDVELRVDDKIVGRQSIGSGDFQMSAPLNATAGKRRIALRFSATQELPGDGRVVSARLQFMGFESAAPAVAQDIVKSAGLRLGDGWGPLESYHNEMFRWVANDAQVRLDAVPNTRAELSVLVEAGPGIGSTAFLLEARDVSGKRIAAARVQGRGKVGLLLPMEAGRPGDYRLHVEGGGKAAPNDPRILNFRVFEISSESRPEAIQ